MKIETQKYVRRALYVEAVQITSENFSDLAEWCQGQIRTSDSDALVEKGNGVNPHSHYIRVRVHNPKSIRQTKGFVGDWILYTDRGYKVYTPKAFKAAFEEAKNGR